MSIYQPSDILELAKMIIIRKIMGHSMLPVLPPGTSVIGWRRLGELKAGQVVIVQIEGKEKIKRISEIKESEVHLVDDNPDGGKDLGWQPSELVVAKIIWPRTKKTET